MNKIQINILYSYYIFNNLEYDSFVCIMTSKNLEYLLLKNKIQVIVENFKSRQFMNYN